jgi:putative membrane protein
MIYPAAWYEDRMSTNRFESPSHAFSSTSPRRAFTVLTLSAATVLFSGPAFAESTAANASDRAFVTAAAQGGMAEVAEGKLAASKTNDPTVKAFARKMVGDHTKANDRLMAIAKKDGFTLPLTVGAENEQQKASLSQLDGKSFESAYLGSQEKGHEKMEQVFRKEIAAGKNPDLVAFAKTTLPVVEEHLSLAKSDSAKVEANTMGNGGTNAQ